MDFRKLETFIEEATALPMNQRTLSRDEFLMAIERSDELIAEVMRFIWYNKLLNNEDRYADLNDSKPLGYKDRIEILLEVLHKSREELLLIGSFSGMSINKCQI